jgi:putative membrane protein
VTTGNKGFYTHFRREDMILRDYLAADRTVLANERTFMAFIRTAIAVAAAGASLMHFFDSGVTMVGGIILLVLAIATLVWGLQRFLHYRRHLAMLGMTDSDWHRQVESKKPGEEI